MEYRFHYFSPRHRPRREPESTKPLHPAYARPRNSVEPAARKSRPENRRGTRVSKKWTWDKMIAEFRALGGVADNICEKKGPLGRGIFPIDAALPIVIRVPDNLLFDAENIAFENGQLRVKEKTPGREREEEFFEKFENVFSWGGGGREDCEAKIAMLLNLPEKIRDMLIADFGLKGIFRDSNDETIQNKFLQSRKIRYQDKSVIMPVLELANHGTTGKTFQFQNGIGLKGTFDGEVLARYSATDPFGIFCGWGFPSDELVAFSLPMALGNKNRRMLIQRNIAQRAVKGQFRVPKMTRNGNRLALSYVMLGNAKFPRLAKGIFYQLMKDVGQINAEELFDRIVHFNVKKFLTLLSALEEFEGDAITELRRVARFQLEAISYHVGSRKL